MKALNGLPGGRFGSSKFPPGPRVVSWKFLSKTSILPVAWLAAYRKFPDELLPMASPV